MKKRKLFPSPYFSANEADISPRQGSDTPSELAELAFLLSANHNDSSQEARKHALFANIHSKSIPFHTVERGDGFIVYGDPSDPTNPAKQIRYELDKETGKWRILPGPQANAIIPDAANNQLVCINGGEVNAYGTSGLFDVIPSPAPALNNHPSEAELKQQDNVLLQETAKRYEEKFGPHPVFIFEVTPENITAIETLHKVLNSITCAKQRGKFVGEFITQQKHRLLLDPMEMLPYTDVEGNWYAWKNGIGLRSTPGPTLQVVTPEATQGKSYAILTCHTNLEEVGLAGVQLLHLKADGTTTYVANTSYKNRQDVPQLSREVIRLPETMIQHHLACAKDSANAFLQGKSYTAPSASQVEAKPSPAPISPPAPAAKPVIGNFTARIANKNTPPALTLPGNMIVTGEDGTPFDLHCTFKQRVHTETLPNGEEKTYGCRNDEFDPYDATVYVLKKRGTAFNPDSAKDQTNAVILEVRENPHEIRIRSGTREARGGTPKGAVKATVTFTKEGKHFQATLTEKENGDEAITLDTSPTSPFKEGAFTGFMCVGGCCELYSPENQASMHNPSPQQQANLPQFANRVLYSQCVCPAL